MAVAYMNNINKQANIEYAVYVLGENIKYDLLNK